ncbi:MAG TPA: DUF362 domain-containing protein [Armatimonadetes bacterium]|nr:DUF362 domain-containing protein [Armatimonadota bacterium]
MTYREDRRQFLRQAAGWMAGAWGLSARGRQLLGAAGRKSRVVIVRDRRLTTASGEQKRQLYRQLLNRGLRHLLGASGPAAWGQLFSPRDVVGIKVNCLGGAGISTQVELAYAIAEGVHSAGVPWENIVIFDRTARDLMAAGYPLSTAPGKVRVYGTDAPFAGYEERVTTRGEIASKLSRIVTEHCTALINVPILKDHEIAGLTAALKNYFGVINNPNKYHGNHCDPYIAVLNALPVIRHKQKLIIGDATTVLYEGGPHDRPEYHWPYGGLFLSRDPVALDQMAWALIERIRKHKGLSTLQAAGRAPTYIATAAKSPYRLGVNNPYQIDLRQEQLA